ncbi:MAG: hypothetical protein QOG38_606, partial [Hyphomicrobiales bacterium]|nr:hypothetical protein [Hyphomicrobiales bacterium]
MTTETFGLVLAGGLARRMGGGPIEPGEDAGQRTDKSRHAVGDHRQTRIR